MFIDEVKNLIQKYKVNNKNEVEKLANLYIDLILNDYIRTYEKHCEEIF